VRVIAGTLRGRRLAAPEGGTTRPTSDRVRESLFMVLGPLDGRRVVDLFAGSGALGIEALSRGAARVDFVEVDRAALACLDANLAQLGLAEVTRVWRVRLPGDLERLRDVLAHADLVLMDPPYGGEAARAVLKWLGDGGLAPDSQVVVEHHFKDAVPEAIGALARVWQRRYGATAVSRYEMGSGDRPPLEEKRA
jgi:16S rRNA (guanine966-N2)-methyltransferase